jgi:hypothetical protein
LWRFCLEYFTDVKQNNQVLGKDAKCSRGGVRNLWLEKADQQKEASIEQKNLRPNCFAEKVIQKSARIKIQRLYPWVKQIEPRICWPGFIQIW